MPPTLRYLVGAVLWIVLLGYGARLLTERRGESESSTLTEVGAFLVRSSAEIDIEFPAPRFIEVGDAVYLDAGSPMAAMPRHTENLGAPIGEISALVEDGEVRPIFVGVAKQARLRFFDSSTADLRRDASVHLLVVPDAFAWVVDTLLTEGNLPRVAAEWNDTMLLHREKIFGHITPIVVRAIEELEATIAESTPPFLRRHEAEIAQLTTALQARFDDATITRLFEREVWPIGEQELRPIVEELGKQIWNKVPVWGFTWRLMYQSLPLTRDDHFERAWQEFVTTEIVPIVKSSQGDILAAVKRVARQALSNEQVVDTLREAFLAMTSHPTFQSLAQQYIKECFLDNPSFHERMKSVANSPEVDRALAAATPHLEPMFRRMGDIIFGTREQGITQEFARVLRAQILQKDRRRIVVRPGALDAALDRTRPIAATVAMEDPR